MDLVRWPKPEPPSRQWERWREEYGKRIRIVGEKCNNVRVARKSIEVVVWVPSWIRHIVSHATMDWLDIPAELSPQLRAYENFKLSPQCLPRCRHVGSVVS